MIRVAVLTNELPPYRRPVFIKLAKSKNLTVEIFLSTDVEPGRQWDSAAHLRDLPVHIVRNVTIRRRQTRKDLNTWQTRFVHLPVGTIPALIRFQPDVIITSEFGFRTLMSWFYCKLARIPMIIWSEETPHHAQGASTLQQILRKYLSRVADGFLAWGKSAEEYLHQLGVHGTTISYCAQAVDNDCWADLVNDADKSEVIKGCGLKGKVVLFIGQLIPRKGVDLLIQAWNLLPPSKQAANSLLIVGEGEEMHNLQGLSAELQVQNVRFLGFKSTESLGKLYAVSHLLVLPSLLEVWGLVVNEAMACGIPVLCSKYAGCANELIVQEVTGSTFDPRATTMFSHLLDKWLSKSYNTPSTPIQQHIRKWDFDVAIQGINEAIYKVLEK